MDATEAPRKLFHAREVIPVNPGPLTLYYPKWIPGEHGPTGPIINLSGLTFTASGKALPWRRDPVDMYAFHFEVPQGTSTLEANLEFLAPTFAGGFTSGSSTTSHLAILSWNWILLYPLLPRLDDLMFHASLRLPPGWKLGTGLTVEQQSAGEVTFRAATLTTLIDDAQGRLALGVLPHEYVHSWNGKYRRPIGLATLDPQTPMQGEMLWVYEGLTQYYGNVLEARSGLWTPEQYRDDLAQVAAILDHTPGRSWRPLIDTTIAAQLLYEAPTEWSAERRGTDFYNEGWLIWLDVDTLIRQLSSGQRSLDDFCRRFHGGQSGPPMVKPYTFDEVVETLNGVEPYDWRTFFNQRLDSTDAHAPLGGVQRGGWQLSYDAVQGQRIKDAEAVHKQVEMDYSLGPRLNTDGLISDVIPGMPAWNAKLGPGMTVVAVDGKKFSADVLRDAVSAARTSTKPVRLLVNNEDTLITYSIDYHGGERYPHLVRDGAKPDLLSQTIAART